MKRKGGAGKLKRPAKYRKVGNYNFKQQSTFYGRKGDDVEKKVQDLGPAQLGMNTTGTFTLLAAPVPGSDYTNRIGRKTLIKSVYIRGIVSCELADQDGPTVGASPCQLGRMIIFADMQPNAAAPALTDLLTSATSISQLNLNNRDRFRIYCDKVFSLNAYAYNTTANSQLASLSNSYAVKKFKKLNLETIYNSGTAGTIADIQSGALYLLTVGNRAAGTDDATATLSTRVRFIDL